MTIKQFTLNQASKNLTIIVSNKETDREVELSFEYLRIFPMVEGNSKENKSLITHKKQVRLVTVEVVGKHGYRLLFDDQFSAIYSAKYLMILAEQYSQRWESYLSDIKASGHSREAMINITQL
ncbi:MAG: gamma-butyrobetaine hydroxylase-like domain-containing protein [Colwellia sp.]